MTGLTLEHANLIIEAALQNGGELALQPLSVAVLDAGACLIAFQRQDGASRIRPEIAIGKASGALALGVSSRKIADMAAERPQFIASLGPVSRDGVIPAAGGIIIKSASGAVLGAVGVTGDTSDNDEICAVAGVEKAGLVAHL